MPLCAISKVSPTSLEISAIRLGLMGIRPFTIASTERLFFRLVTRTLVLKDRLGWDMCNPVFELLYEASPVWVWAAQKNEKNRAKTAATLKRFIKTFLLLGFKKSE
jgi:hypothetical protein